MLGIMLVVMAHNAIPHLHHHHEEEHGNELIAEHHHNHHDHHQHDHHHNNTNHNHDHGELDFLLELWAHSHCHTAHLEQFELIKLERQKKAHENMGANFIALIPSNIVSRLVSSCNYFNQQLSNLLVQQEFLYTASKRGPPVLS